MKLSSVLLSAIFAASLFAMGAGCSKVDCAKMCGKSKDCFDEILMASGGLDKKKVDMLKKMKSRYDKLKDDAHSKCMKKCTDQKGRGRDAADVNKCLKKGSCKDYASCIKKAAEKS